VPEPKDARIASALANWAPRFTTNGVLVSDFQEVTGGLEHWGEWCAAWSKAAGVHERLGRDALTADRTRSAGEHLARAALYYHFGKFLYFEDPAEAREAHTAAVRCLNDALPHLDPPGVRLEVPYQDGRLVGVLRIPTGPGPHPAVLLIPGLDSTKEEFRTTERTFLDRGLATFSADGPGQGEAEFDHGLPITAAWEEPGRALIDALAAQPGIDPSRIAVWGVSLGGYYAPRVAAGDDRIRACVALAGPYDFGAAWDQLPQLTREAFRHRSGSPDAPTAARAAHELTLSGHTKSLTCPLLVITGKRDRLFPWQDARRLVEEASGPAKLLALEEGNHGCANVPAHHRPYTADWLAGVL
jgi:dienelactone hydrolase